MGTYVNRLMAASRGVPFALSTGSPQRAAGLPASRQGENAPAAHRPAFHIVRRNKQQLALAVIDPRIIALERRRVAKGISHNDLCGMSRVHPTTWFYLRSGQQQPRAETLKSLAAAIAACAPRRPAASAVQILMQAVTALIVRELGGDRALMAACSWRRPRKQLPRAVVPARLRIFGFYLLAVELEIANADIARSMACSRQAIKQARDDVEDLRQAHAGVDALFARCIAKLKGEGA